MNLKDLRKQIEAIKDDVDQLRELRDLINETLGEAPHYCPPCPMPHYPAARRDIFPGPTITWSISEAGAARSVNIVGASG